MPDPSPPRSTEVVPPTSGEHVLVQQFTLTVIAGPDAGAIHTSASERTVIGTHESASFLLGDRSVSRLHCEIVITDGRAAVRDLGSLNGVLVDGVPVTQAPLRPGAVLSLGRTQLAFALRAEQLRVELSRRERYGAMVGRSRAMRAVFAVLERVAATDATVLLEGETGTGKEVAAESIHRESARAEGPFVVVDCGSIPPELIESELFGHARGAFTGADGDRAGAFEEAQGGTLFLDEIGELRADLQPKLLRVLDRKEVKRVGSTKTVPLDFRVIAATNRDLRAEVNAGNFRPDLYYRLAVVQVRLPPLRERVDDLSLLVEHLLAAQGASEQAAAMMRTSEFVADLRRHAWPGNVRELRNYVDRCLTLRERTPLPQGGGQAILDSSAPFKIAREAWTQHFERRYLEEVLERHGKNVSAAARAAGLDRIYFYRLLWKHGLR